MYALLENQFCCTRGWQQAPQRNHSIIYTIQERPFSSLSDILHLWRMAKTLNSKIQHLCPSKAQRLLWMRYCIQSKRRQLLRSVPSGVTSMVCCCCCCLSESLWHFHYHRQQLHSPDDGLEL